MPEELARAVEVVLDPPVAGFRFYLLAATGSEVAPAFWSVNATTDDRKASMVWGKFLLSTCFGQDFVQEPMQIDMAGAPPSASSGSLARSRWDGGAAEAERCGGRGSGRDERST